MVLLLRVYGELVSAQSPRRLDAHEHLYARGLERQARQKNREEQAKAAADASSKEADTCSRARSRRYYWQMLERQIRAISARIAGDDKKA
ncbi:hypothetical protein AK812_SmicGene7949 [Symbiodinium microadriaticum]|uniref:Uncharacterized protein n=1 Tax=Symbiodinium microadriaticum TaxID=2951 RepID=A0A1Q9EM63_SYMMI|nr:hypothetical protein AK812_SmicGene7949 [Symbiodinium microadriaticum]